MNTRDETGLRIKLTCKSLHELAVRFSPVLAFHPEERFFPVLAESYLTHTTEAPWSDDVAHQLGDIAADPHRRGMALCQMLRGRLHTIAGPPVGGDRPLQLSNTAGDPYALGRSELAKAGKSTFLELAGWRPDSSMAAGDVDRLFALFSEQAAAINQTLDWEPLQGRDDLPHAWIPVSVNPTTYCEARWAGAYPRISDSAQTADFVPGDSMLDPFLALTYHYLYPAREPGPGGDGMSLEGQWEAATLFFRGESLGKGTGVVQAPPEAVVVSQGIVQSSQDHHVTAFRPWDQVQKVGEHPLLFVAKGTHRFFFDPVGGSTGNPAGNPPNPGADPGSHDDARHEGGITDLAVLGLILLVIAAIILLVLAWILVAIALIILALIAFFSWLASLFDAGSNDNSGSPLPGSGGNDEANGSGTQAGGDQPPAGTAPPAGAGAGTATVGLPNTGSPTGQATVSFDVRLVDRMLPGRHKPTPYPSPELCENPTWWDYSGRWGVLTLRGLGAGWESGTRRCDEQGRSWGYWCALRLTTVLHGGAAAG